MSCALGIILALFERTRSDRGQVIDAGMVSGASYLNSFIFQMFQLGSWNLEKGTNLLDTGAPFYDVYKTKDNEYVAVGPLEPHFFGRLIKGLGLEESSFTQGDRSTWPAMKKLFSDVFASKSREEWSKIFDGTDACVAPVLKMNELNTHPHTKSLELLYTDEEGNQQVSAAPSLSRTPARRSSGVFLQPGQHTIPVMREFGFTASDIKSLLDEKVIGTSESRSSL